MSCFRVPQFGVVAFVGTLVVVQPAFTQYMGNNFRGDFGVNSGTQAGPGLYVVIPFAQWNVNSAKDAAGNPLLASRFQSFDVRAVFPTVMAVTPKKLLGANYGFMVAVPFSAVRPERATEEFNQSGWAFNDMYVVPLYLGWHTARSDFVAGYGFYAPTGRYSAGADDNVGFGMWGHEIQGGTTVYLDPAKRFSVATTAFFEMHSNKKDQDLKVGNLLTLEGGAAYNDPKIGAAFGVAYYAQTKLSDDSGDDLPLSTLTALNLYGKNRLFGVGPDVTMPVFKIGGTIGLVNVRYFWESGGKSSFQGSTFVAGLTFARPKMN